MFGDGCSVPEPCNERTSVCRHGGTDALVRPAERSSAAAASSPADRDLARTAPPLPTKISSRPGKKLTSTSHLEVSQGGIREAAVKGASVCHHGGTDALVRPAERSSAAAASSPADRDLS
jgi:hypothetical protein